MNALFVQRNLCLQLFEIFNSSTSDWNNFDCNLKASPAIESSIHASKSAGPNNTLSLYALNTWFRDLLCVLFHLNPKIQSKEWVI